MDGLSDEPAVQHLPVLLTETVAHIAPRPGVRVLDCTLGLGGHSEALLVAGASVVGVDRDEAALMAARSRLAAFGDRLTTITATFADAAEDLVREGQRFDAVLADLGVSSLQLDDRGRGFSLRCETTADMRMGVGCAGTALDLIDRCDEHQLRTILYEYGEERHAPRIVRALKRERAGGRLNSAVDIAGVVRAAVPGRHPRHPALRTLQALRIAVNDELGQLHRLLAVLPSLLAPGGRGAIISFHSLEDRPVKHTLRDHVAAGRLASASRHPITASEAELAANPRAASAKLRLCSKAS